MASMAIHRARFLHDRASKQARLLLAINVRDEQMLLHGESPARRDPLARPAQNLANPLGPVDVSRSAARSFVEARASSRKEGSMGILWIILIVVVVLALLGFFGFRR